MILSKNDITEFFPDHLYKPGFDQILTMAETIVQRIGCPSGSVFDTKQNACIYRFKHPSCGSDQVLVPKIGDWRQTEKGLQRYPKKDKCMLPVLLSFNNRKTSDIPTFSLPSQVSCPVTTDTCEKYCYANKAERSWQWPLISRSRNLWASKQPEFVDWMTEALEKIDSKYIRLHDSGDFYNDDYKKKWFDICKKFPNKKFLAFTHNCGLSWKGKPKNMIVYCSIWPDSPKSHRKKKLKAYIYDEEKLDMKHKPKGRSCPAQLDHSITCSKCRLCWDKPKNIVFKLH